MKVVCINNRVIIDSHGSGKTSELTMDKIYDAHISLTDEDKYYLCNDNGQSSYYFTRRFRLLDDVREEKINKILG